MRRIVLLGNCQISSLTGLYRRFAQRSRREHIVYLPSYTQMSDEDRALLHAADLVVEQVLDFAAKSDASGLAPHVRRIAVPVVNGGFLWPYAGQPHPNNPKPDWFDATGPYSVELGDAFLNRMIRKGVAVDDAISQYIATNVNSVMPLDRLLDIALEKQRNRDSITGFSIAGIIEQHFRDESLFLTPYHPRLRITLALAQQLFERMDVPEEDIALMRRALRRTPFPRSELPVHPAVARHFNLRWAQDGRRYQFYNEGQFTFEQFARRYMTCQWNAALEEGLALGRGSDFVRAEERLRAGLATSPDSSKGLRALSAVLERAQRYDEALALAQQSVAVDPDDGALRAALGVLLRQAGRMTDADRELRLAVALEPYEPHFVSVLVQFLRQQGALAEAIAWARLGLTCAPGSVGLHVQLGQALETTGDDVAAEQSYRAAINAAPQDCQAAVTALARLLERQGRPPEPMSIEIPERPKPIQADLPPIVAAPEPQDDAIAAARRAATANPNKLELQCELAALLIKRRDWAAAEQVLRAAVDINPNSSHVRAELGFVLGEAGKLELALEERRVAVKLDAGNPHRLMQLSHTLAKSGDLLAAENAIRQAIALKPGRPQHHAELARLLLRARRPADAVAPARRAAELSPRDPSSQILLADTCQKSGRFDDAEKALNAALRLGADAARIHRLTAELEAERVAASAPAELDARDVALQFESLGGNGHGCEFGIFQRTNGAEPLGLLRWADLAVKPLIEALECQFDGVGQPDHTIVFQPDGSKEWWTRDKRFHMAMRTFVSVAEMPYQKMVQTGCARLQFLRRKLIDDLREGQKIFVYKNMFRDLTNDELTQLHRAVRAYGPATLLCLKYAKPASMAGTVQEVAPGLLIGHIERYSFSPENKHIGPIDQALMEICRKALRLRRAALPTHVAA